MSIDRWICLKWTAPYSPGFPLAEILREGRSEKAPPPLPKGGRPAKKICPKNTKFGCFLWHFCHQHFKQYEIIQNSDHKYQNKLISMHFFQFFSRFWLNFLKSAPSARKIWSKGGRLAGIGGRQGELPARQGRGISHWGCIPIEGQAPFGSIPPFGSYLCLCVLFVGHLPSHVCVWDETSSKRS